MLRSSESVREYDHHVAAGGVQLLFSLKCDWILWHPVPLILEVNTLLDTEYKSSSSEVTETRISKHVELEVLANRTIFWVG
jgi:hypothetical protein